MEINPQKLIGNWDGGWALDLHTLYSNIIGPDEFDTKRTPIGEELYLLKYRDERNHVVTIAETAAEFLKTKRNEWNIDIIIPVPPSNTTRIYQPVYEIAKSIGMILGIPVDFTALKKEKSTLQLKNIEDPIERKELLKDAFDVEFNVLSGKNVLIFDDLYRSGETLNAVCKVIRNKGKANKVYVLTITKTRSKR